MEKHTESVCFYVFYCANKIWMGWKMRFSTYVIQKEKQGSSKYTHTHTERKRNIFVKKKMIMLIVCVRARASRGRANGWVHGTYYTKCLSSSQKQLLIATVIILSLRPSRFSIVFQQLRLFHPIKSQKTRVSECMHTHTQSTHLFIHICTLSHTHKPSIDTFAVLCISTTTFHMPSF